VVGAGHNGLVAACYLAREGVDVTVVERDTVVGGAVSTVERWPRNRVDPGSSVHVMVRHTRIIEDQAHDDTYQDLDPWGWTPHGDITFHVDLDRTCESIENACGTRDADAYRAFALDWGQRNAKVFDAFQGPPTAARLGKAIWGAGRGTGLPGVELARQFLTSGDSLLDSLFDDERLKTALAWMGSQSGPPTHEPATADLVGWNAVMHQRAPGHPVGGSGALSVALQRRLESYGGRVLLGEPAVAVDARAVRTSDRELPADVVIGACHVLTFLELADHPLLERARRTVRVGNGIGMVVRLAPSALPEYPRPATYRAMQLLARSREQLRLAFGQYGAGLVPDDPPVLAMTHSAFDDTLAPPGRQTVTLWGQWYPYRLAHEDWDAIGPREAEKLVAAVDAVAPGFADTVEAMHVQTPLDLERELGLRQGQVMHLEMGLDQMFAWRPLPELAGYRLDAGRYLCGASTHPGGGVFGASGRTVAQLVLRDRRRHG
jgi:phytoene dehydrogenase-like protein